MTTIDILSPVPSELATAGSVRPALTDLHGATFAILDNTKPNALELMSFVADDLVSRFGGDYFVVRKLSAAQGASVAELDHLADKATFVLTGSGD